MSAAKQSSDPTADLLPARMLNEFVYCPRLFYYEHVEGVFLHNADTKRGASEHTRVDSGRGELPKNRKKADEDASKSDVQSEPTEGEGSEAPSTAAELPANVDAEVIHARSVMLGSQSLGVVAKLDLIEVTLEGGRSTVAESAVRAVCPVEYKTGVPRESGDGRALWDADRMQLGLQILLLRENGYACDEGVVFYRQTRQRVRFTMTGEDEAWIRRGVAAARSCSTGPIPPPLDHSPKCPRCSLAPVCLPDETKLMQVASPDAELPPSESQLALPGLVIDATGTIDEDKVALLADALGSEDPSWESLPEPRFPRAVAEGEVRRLIAPDVDTKVLYINTPGVVLAKKGETVVIKEKGETLSEVRIKDLHHLAVFGAAQISTALIQTLCDCEVPISYFSMGGWFYGITRGHGLSNVFTRIRQFARAADAGQALPVARLFVYGKIRNQRTLLMRNHVEPPARALLALKHAAAAALSAPNQAALLGIEGAAALVYFRNFSGMIKGEEATDEIPGLEEEPSARIQAAQTAFSFDFKTRNRRPPRDPVNALLSLGYSLLARDCTVAALAVGFDPYIGLYHQPRFGRPALALDVMEEFRPLIADSAVLTAINNRMLSPSDFVQAGEAVNLTPSGRKRFFLAYEKRMSDTVTHPLFDYKVSYRRAIELQFRLLARTLTGEIERYLPFTTR
ncbi:MAG TPA: CRISPR-associated endonuclease Cas1 [Opitutaceae bacterium]|nr:CRISPR-associated endonuclease Cas1 [Opitutaceae bacterium]